MRSWLTHETARCEAIAALSSESQEPNVPCEHGAVTNISRWALAILALASYGLVAAVPWREVAGARGLGTGRLLGDRRFELVGHKGCSNWKELTIEMHSVGSVEACRQLCRGVEGCSSFNHAFISGCGGATAGACLLFNNSVGECQHEEKGCWDLYSEEASTSVPALAAPAQTEATVECFSRSASPVLTIVTVAVGMSAEFIDALRENRALEANAFGYEYCEFTHSLDPKRDLAWSKIKSLQALLARGRKRLVWMDADAFFVRLRRFDEFTKAYFDAGKDIVFTDDKNDDNESAFFSPVNTGVMDMVNTEWTRGFWESCYNDFPEAINHRYWDQEAVILFRERRLEEFDAHAAIIPHEPLNSVESVTSDFIAHRAAGHFENKYVEIVPYVLQVNRVMREAGSDASLVASKFRLLLNAMSDKFKVIF